MNTRYPTEAFHSTIDRLRGSKLSGIQNQDIFRDNIKLRLQAEICLLFWNNPFKQLRMQAEQGVHNETFNYFM